MYSEWSKVGLVVTFAGLTLVGAAGFISANRHISAGSRVMSAYRNIAAGSRVMSAYRHIVAGSRVVSPYRHIAAGSRVVLVYKHIAAGSRVMSGNWHFALGLLKVISAKRHFAAIVVVLIMSLARVNSGFCVFVKPMCFSHLPQLQLDHQRL
jgi:hypothetical protein